MNISSSFKQHFLKITFSRAHNTLFISELASQRDRLPEDLRTPPGQDKPARGKKEKQNSVVTSLLKRKAIKPAALEYDSE